MTKLKPPGDNVFCIGQRLFDGTTMAPMGVLVDLKYEPSRGWMGLTSDASYVAGWEIQEGFVIAGYRACLLTDVPTRAWSTNHNPRP